MRRTAIFLLLVGASSSQGDDEPVWPDYWRNSESASVCSLTLSGHIVESDNGYLIFSAHFAFVAASNINEESEADGFGAFLRENSPTSTGELALVLAISGGSKNRGDARGPINLNTSGRASKIFESPIPLRDRPLNRFLILSPDSEAIRTELVEGQAVHFELTYPSGLRVKFEHREPSPLPFQQRNAKLNECIEGMLQKDEVH